MTISFREVADRCDDFDKEIEDIQDARKKFWAEIRETVVPSDVRALKAAIKARRKRKADLDGEEAFDQRVAEILAEIEAGTDLANISTRAGAPREVTIVGRHVIDLDTGEIIEPSSAQAGVEAGGPQGRSVSEEGAVSAKFPAPSSSPPHDADGVLIEEQNSSDCQDAVGAGQSASPSGEAVREAAPTIEEPAVAESAPAEAGQEGGRKAGSREAGVSSSSVAPPINSDNDAQHEAAVETTSPMPEAINSLPSPASSQEPCTHGSGEVQDRCESTSPPDFPSLPAFLDRRSKAA